MSLSGLRVMNGMDERVTFRETQRFRQPWLWVLIGGVGVVSLVAGAGIGAVIAAGVAALFAVARLTTEVREDGVYVRFAPFHRSFRRIGFEEIERHGPREFGMLTYGGIGIRWTPSAVAYVTRRGDGVEIHRENGKTVVIGSQQADRLAAAIGEG